jgi:hypothetical protein
MHFEDRPMELPIAVLTHVRPDLLEVRYKDGAIITPKGLHEIHEAHKQLCWNTPHAVLYIIPVSVGYEVESMQQAYWAPGEDPVVAMAVAAGSAEIQMVTRLYFTYFPQVFPTLVTNDRSEALAWLEARLAELSSAARPPLHPLQGLARP